MQWRTPFTAALAALVVVGIITTRVDATPRRTSAGPVMAAPNVSEEIFNGVVTDLQRFVENSRGLLFKKPVHAAMLDDAAFAARRNYTTSTDTVSEDIDRTLGILDPAVSHAALTTGDDPDVLGFYDHTRKELFVRGTELSPYVRYVLVHELTHALQDQHFDLTRISRLGVADEADIGLRTIAEGDATRVQDAYYASLSPDQQRSIDAIEDPESVASTTTTTTTPPRPTPVWPGNRGAEYQTLFPYALGPRLVARLIHEGGQAKLDDGFRHPAIASEQLIYVGDSLAKKRLEQPRPMETPAAEGVPIAEGPFGVMALNTLFYSQWSQIGWQYGDWAGGRYVAWKQGDATCVRFAVVMDNGYAAASLKKSLEQVVQFHGEAYVTGPNMPTTYSYGTEIPNGPVVFTTCGPPKTRTWDQAQAVLAAQYNKQMSEQWRTCGCYGPPPRYTPQQYQLPQPPTWATNY